MYAEFFCLSKPMRVVLKNVYCFIVARELKQIKDEDEYFNLASPRTSVAGK